MNVLGVRCDNKGFTYVIMKGSKTSPELIWSESCNAPAGYPLPRKNFWLYQEIDLLIKEYDINRVALKGAEPSSRKNKTMLDRVELEAIIICASQSNGIKRTVRKIKSTIAKDLHLKGRAKYLKTDLDTSLIKDYEKLSIHKEEALLAAWSEL